MFHTLVVRVMPFQLVIVIDFFLLMNSSLILRNALIRPDSVLRTRLVSTPKSILLQSVAASVKRIGASSLISVRVPSTPIRRKLAA